MSDSVTLDGVVLSRRSFAEGDLSVTLFTKQRGKISVVARGARKPKSKLAGASEPGVEGQFQVILGRSRFIMGQVMPSRSRVGVHRKYETLMSMLYMLELIGAAAPENIPSESLYRLLQFGLGMIDQDADPVSSVATLQCLLLHSQGISPRFDSCMRCHQDSSGRSTQMSMVYGGLICNQCSFDVHDLVPLALGAASIWEQLIRFESVKGSIPDDWSALLLASHLAVRHHLGHDLKNWPLYIQAMELGDTAW